MNDHSLFHKKVGSSVTFVAVYVDDVLLTRIDLIEIDSLKAFLDHEFKIKDLGQLHYFLGMQFAFTDKGVLMNQKRFIQNTIEEFHCAEPTPFVVHLRLLQYPPQTTPIFPILLFSDSL